MTGLNRSAAVVSFLTLRGLCNQANVIVGSVPFDHPARPALLAVKALGSVFTRCSALVDTQTPHAQMHRDRQTLAAAEFAQVQVDDAIELIGQHPWEQEEKVRSSSDHTLRKAGLEQTRVRFNLASQFLIEIDSTKGAVAYLPAVFVDTAEHSLTYIGSCDNDVAERSAAVAAFQINVQQADKAVSDLIVLLVEALTPQF